MRVFRTQDAVQIGPSACAIGMFDGIHLGHRLVLEHAIRASHTQGLESVVFTFANHPQSIISQTPTSLLSTLEERIAAFEAFGFDAALILDFTPDLKAISAHDFVQHILIDTLHIKAVSVGYDHRFGKGRQGDGAFLKAEGDRLGFEVMVVEPVKQSDQIISSTLIRKLLSYGDIEKANALLGRPYTLQGSVIHGVGRGKTIGFPTANLAIPADRLVPGQGVYAGWVLLETDTDPLPAVCNIGVAPTFGDQAQPRVEVHILGQNIELYDRPLAMAFTHRLRDEQSFDSVEALVRQIHADCERATQALGVSV